MGGLGGAWTMTERGIDARRHIADGIPTCPESTRCGGRGNCRDQQSRQHSTAQHSQPSLPLPATETGRVSSGPPRTEKGLSREEGKRETPRGAHDGNELRGAGSQAARTPLAANARGGNSAPKLAFSCPASPRVRPPIHPPTPSPAFLVLHHGGNPQFWPVPTPPLDSFPPWKRRGKHPPQTPCCASQHPPTGDRLVRDEKTKEEEGVA